MENPAAIFARANENATQIILHENAAAFSAMHAAFTVNACLHTSMQTGKLDILDFVMSMVAVTPMAAVAVLPGVLLGKFFKPQRDISHEKLSYGQIHEHLLRCSIVPASVGHLGMTALMLS